MRKKHKGDERVKLDSAVPAQPSPRRGGVCAGSTLQVAMESHKFKPHLEDTCNIKVDMNTVLIKCLHTLPINDQQYSPCSVVATLWRRLLRDHTANIIGISDSNLIWMII